MENNINKFLNSLNTYLSNFQFELEIPIDEKFPNIFILGLPRSGTTLLSQVIFNHLDVACTNNLIAKFWDAPLTGAYLSKILIGNKKNTDYSSNYGKTLSIESPHEFSYFWRKHLMYNNPENYNPKEVLSQINWKTLKRLIYSLNTILERPIMFKTLEYTGFHLSKFKEIFPNSFYIYIQRDFLETAISIYKARETINKSVSSWWSSYPLEYESIKKKKYSEQISGQIYYLNKLYNNGLKTIPDDSYIEISFNELLQEPHKILKTIRNKIKSHTGYNINIVKDIKPFKEVKKNITNTIKRELITSLNNYGLI